MLRADLHLHTNASPDSRVTPEALVKCCLRKDINCIAVTDHNTMNGVEAVQRLAPFKVIPAEEIKTSEGEIIGYFLREAIPARLSPEETVRRIKDQGGLVAVPHPFDRLRREPLKEAALMRVLSEIDILEGLNARVTIASENRQAVAFAAEHDLACSAGSDAHSLLEVGTAFVEMPEFDSPQQFLESLREGTLCGGRSVPLVHLISTWAKVRKRFLR
jgi:predicted metal-dependent phosphoesterase TrpH